MNNEFTLDHTHITKGMATILLLFHHIFYDDLFIGIPSGQVYFFPYISSLLCRSGFICIYIFAIISGFGICKSMGNKDLKTAVLKRETNLLTLFISVYIIFAIIYMVLNGLSTYLAVYKYFDFGPCYALFNIVIDALGLSSILHLHTINPTWWYMSAAHMIIIALPLLIDIARKHNARTMILVIMALLCGFAGTDCSKIFMCLFTAYIGYYICELGLLDKRVTVKSSIITTVLFMFGLLFTLLVSDGYNPDFLFAVFSFMFLILAKYCVSRIIIVRDVLRYIGKDSDVVFMVHTFFYMILIPFKNFVFSFKYAFVTYILVGVFSLITAFIIKKIIKSKPYQKLTKAVLDILQKKILF